MEEEIIKEEPVRRINRRRTKSEDVGTYRQEQKKSTRVKKKKKKSYENLNK